MCIITAHAIFISPTIKYNIMNTDSKPNRCVVLLNKAPFILFIESTNCLLSVEYLLTALEVFNLSFADTLTRIHVKPDQDLRKIISATNTLADPLAYNIIEALATAIMGESPTGLFSIRLSSVTPYIMSNEWQRNVKWQNVDNKPEPVTATHEFTITVNKITHELHIIHSNDFDRNSETYVSAVHLSSVNIDVPLHKVLLKDCAVEIYDTIIKLIKGSPFYRINQSKYVSAMQTGYETFNWCNLKKIEKDLITVLTAAGITIEE